MRSSSYAHEAKTIEASSMHTSHRSQIGELRQKGSPKARARHAPRRVLEASGGSRRVIGPVMLPCTESRVRFYVTR